MRPPPCQDPLLGSLQPTQSNPCFDDRIEIENLGVLIPGLSLDDLPSGIPVILEEAANLNLPPPLFEELGLRFRVTLPLAESLAPAQGQSQPRGAESRAESGAESRAESLAEGRLAVLVLQTLADGPLSKSEIAHALGRDSVSGALNRTIRQLLDRDEIAYTLPDTPNSRLQKYRLHRGLQP